MDFQKLINAMNSASERSRSNYHLTLGSAIAALSSLDRAILIGVDTGGGVRELDSYRGYYSDLAFRPSGEATPIGVVLDALQAALGQTFQGYKGGDFLMHEKTPLWLSPYGDNSGIAIVGLETQSGVLVFVTKKVGE